MRKILIAACVLMLAGQSWGTEYFVWEASDGTEYYSITAFGSGGTANANALDIAIGLSVTGDTINVGAQTSATLRFSESLIGKDNIKIIKTSDDGYSGDVTLSGISGTFFSSNDQVEGLEITGPFIIDDTAGVGEFWDSTGSVVGFKLTDVLFQNFNTDEPFEFRGVGGFQDCIFDGVAIRESTYPLFMDTSDSADNVFIDLDMSLKASSTGSFLISGNNYTFYRPRVVGRCKTEVFRFLSAEGTKNHRILFPMFIDGYSSDGYEIGGGIFAYMNGSGSVTVDVIGGQILSAAKPFYASGIGAVINSYSTVTVSYNDISTEASGGVINHYDDYILSRFDGSNTNGNIFSALTLTSSGMAMKLADYAPPFAAIVPCMDDTEDNLVPKDSRQKTVVDEWISEGVTGVLYVQPGSSDDPENGKDFTGNADFEALQTYVANGQLDVGPHTMSHISLFTDDAFKIKKTAALDGEVCTRATSATGFSIDCATTDAADVEFLYSDDDFDSPGEIYNAIEAGGFFTVSDAAWADSPTRGLLQVAAEVLAQTTVAIPASGDAAASVAYDATSRWTWEIGQTKQWLMDNFNLDFADIRSMAAPGGQTPEEFFDFLESTEDTIGILMSRGYKESTDPTFQGSMERVRNLNTKIVQTVGWTNWAGGTVADYTAGTITDASIRRRCSGMAEWAKVFGAVLMPYSHDTTTEANAAMWSACIDGVKDVDPGLFKDIDTVIDYVRSGTQDATYPEVWNQDWSDDYEWDFSIGSDSVLINAGTEAGTVGLTGEQTDGEGNTVTLPGLYNLNIGVDQTKFNVPSIQGGTILSGKIIGN